MARERRCGCRTRWRKRKAPGTFISPAILVILGASAPSFVRRRLGVDGRIPIADQEKESRPYPSLRSPPWPPWDNERTKRPRLSRYSKTSTTLVGGWAETGRGRLDCERASSDRDIRRSRRGGRSKKQQQRDGGFVSMPGFGSVRPSPMVHSHGVRMRPAVHTHTHLRLLVSEKPSPTENEVK